MGKVIVKKFRDMNIRREVSYISKITFVLSLFMFVWCQTGQVFADSPVMHSSNNTSTTYGTWGTTKSCNWCHTSNGTSNVKRILQNITTPTGKRQVIFSRMTTSFNTVNGVMGNDNRSYAVNASTNVCEVCHHKTKYHRYSSNAPDKTHANNQDCTGCHSHGAGFKASCDSCHGNPPASNTVGAGGLAKNNAGQTTGFTSFGAHVVHATTESMKCATCHNNNATGGHPGNTVQMGFSLNNTNWSHLVGTGASYGSYSGTTLSSPYSYASSDSATTVVTAAGARNSCNVYCHGAWSGSNGSTNPRWTGGSADAACGTCHGATNAQTPLTGSHTQHAATTVGNYGFSCTKCHPSVASGTFTHVDASVQWRLSTGSRLIGVTGFTPQYRTASSGATGTIAPSATFGNCTNIYCHSSGQSATGGALTSSNFATIQWGNSAAVTCGACHYDMSSDATNATGDHKRHAQDYSTNVNFKCGTCHKGYSATKVNTATHVNRTIYLNFSGIAANTAYSKYSAAGFAPGKGYFGYCNNSYCHSNAQGQNASTAVTYRKPLWGTTTLTCGGCHQNMNTFTNVSSGDHQRHAKDYAFTCSYCHGSGYNATTVNVQTHVNRKINVDFSASTITSGTVYSKYSAAGFAPAKGYYGTCKTSYCHSNGQSDNAKAPIYRQPKWGVTSLSCDGCHNNMATFANATSGSHFAHAYQSGNAKYTCDICHGSGYTGTSTVPRTSGSTHVNRKVDLSLTGYSKYSSAGFTPAKGYYGTCNVSNCHGTGRPTWGASAAVPVNGFPFSSNTCEKCHGQANSNPFYSTAIPKNTSNTDTQVGAHFNHLSSNSGRISHSASCNDCHPVPATVTASGHLNGAIEVTYPTGSLARGSSGTVFPTYSSATHSCATVYCHGDSLKSNKNARGAKLAAIQKAPRWGSPFLSANHATAPTSADCGACHGFPPSSAAHKGVVGYQAYTASQNIAPASSNCNACHKHVNANGTFPGWGIGLHINGAVEGGDCVGCHAGEQSAGTTTRIAAASQFSAQSHHVQGRAVTVTDCYVCHWEANSDGSVNTTYHDQTSGKPVELADWTAGSRSATAFFKYTASGTRAQINKLTTFCTGCHNDTNKNLAPFSGDSNTTSQYAWETSKTSIAARYNQTGTTKWGKYSTANTNRKSQMKKAYSAHGNAGNNEQGWSATGGVDGITPSGAAIAPKAIPNNTGAVVVACYDCHNSHGSAASGITSSYSSATGKTKGGLAKTTVAGRGGYSVTYTPTSGGTDARRSGDLYNPGAALCFDCHIKLSTANQSPWGYNTFGATQPILGYWDTKYFGNYTTFPSTRYGRFPYKSGTGSAALGRNRDMGQNFGGHFGKYSTMITTPKSDINHICTPCHDPHGVSPTLGGNQQYSVPLLKGTWITSPYREDAAVASNAVNRGGGSKQAVMAGGSNPVYRIDQNTFQANRATVNQSSGTNYVFGNFTSNATAYKASTMQTYSSGQFAGLCFRCHSKANLNNTAAVSTTNWKSMTRVHNSVAGWALTTGTGLNASNATHSYTCSKCHAPHNSRLPRLLVTNCLNYQHRGRLASGGSIASTRGNSATTNTGNLISTVNSTGKGAGRFPSGGARYTGTRGIGTSTGSAKYPGPWVFGKAQLNAPERSYGTECHSTGTAGGDTPAGGTYTPTNQRWNNLSPW